MGGQGCKSSLAVYSQCVKLRNTCELAINYIVYNAMSIQRTQLTVLLAAHTCTICSFILSWYVCVIGLRLLCQHNY